MYDHNKELTGRYVVVRDSRATARKTFWKVLSRPFKNKQSAKNWMDFERSLPVNKKYNLMIVQYPSLDDVY